MTAPDDFVAELHSLLSDLAAGRGHVSDRDLDGVLGKCGRLAFLIPGTRPFVSALWGARAASVEAARGRKREAPPGRHAARRFAPAARWLCTVLRPPSALATVVPPLEHCVSLHAQPIDPEGPHVEIDASPWGGGAVLYVNVVPIEFFSYFSTGSARF